MTPLKKKRVRVGVLIATLTLFNTVSAFANWTQGNAALHGQATMVQMTGDDTAALNTPLTLGFALRALVVYFQPQQYVLDPGPDTNTQYIWVVASGHEHPTELNVPVGSTLSKEDVKMAELD